MINAVSSANINQKMALYSTPRAYMAQNQSTSNDSFAKSNVSFGQKFPVVGGKGVTCLAVGGGLAAVATSVLCLVATLAPKVMADLQVAMPALRKIFGP